MSFIQKNARFILLLILGFSFMLSIGAMKDETATFDERAHIPAAYSYVRYGDMRLNPEHPPLLKDLSGLFLLSLQPFFPIQSDLWTKGITKEWQNGTSMWSTWSIGTEFLYNSGNDTEKMIFLLRLPIILLSTLLGYFIYKFTKEISGTLAALFATLLYAFDPNVLAHNHYVTTDLGIAAFIFIATYYFIHFLKAPTWKNIWLAGITLGLAQLAKFSAFILLPLFGIFGIVYALTKQSSSILKNQMLLKWKNVWKFSYQFFFILCITFSIVWVVYAINTRNMPPEITRLHANLVFSGNEPAKTFAREIILNLTNAPILQPIAHYMLGFFMVFSRIAGGNSFYFMGAMQEHAVKMHFPIVFLLKETLPLLFLITGVFVYSLIYVIRKIYSSQEEQLSSFTKHFQDYPAQYFMAFFIVFYVYISIFGNLNIGFRHIFPILPFIHVLVSIGLFSFIKKISHKKANVFCPTRQLYHILTGIFIFWIIIIPVKAYPNYLPYFNETIGGTKNGHTISADSNYDWGQSLKHLKVWIDTYNRCQIPHTVFENTECKTLTYDGKFPTTTPIEHINLDYYGGSEPSYYFSKDFYTEWHSNKQKTSGWFAISATFFEENTHKKLASGETNYSWLLKYKPVGSAGDSILIFYIDESSL